MKAQDLKKAINKAGQVYVALKCRDDVNYIRAYKNDLIAELCWGGDLDADVDVEITIYGNDLYFD
jgi:hypothetical protein